MSSIEDRFKKIDAELLDDDLLDAIFNSAHVCKPSPGWNPETQSARIVVHGPARRQRTGVSFRPARRRARAAARTRHGMYMPPLTLSVSPVMYAAAGVARNRTASAMSCG